MIGKKTNEIAVIAKEAAEGGAVIGEKANENASFQFSVSSVQPRNEENGKHLSPALVPTTASRGEGDVSAAGCLRRVEDGLTAGRSGVAAMSCVEILRRKSAKCAFVWVLPRIFWGAIKRAAMEMTVMRFLETAMHRGEVNDLVALSWVLRQYGGREIERGRVELARERHRFNAAKEAWKRGASDGSKMPLKGARDNAW